MAFKALLLFKESIYFDLGNYFKDPNANRKGKIHKFKIAPKRFNYGKNKKMKRLILV